MSLHECASQTIESNIRRVVVEQNEIPVGIVSDTDIF
ncbi:MAG: CBS domain-containing protein [Candidatus Tectomicrobia bacterium]|jgi:isocitrate dehydrogenase|nr:CBS domain-containing protein [Candidatus Tectomicrobia bacterium]